VGGDAELAAGLGDEAVADGEFFAAGGGAGNRGAELLGDGRGVERGGWDRAVGEDGDHVIHDLDEAAVGVVALLVGAGFDPQFAKAEAADQRRVLRRDAVLAVDERDRDGVGLRVQDRCLGGDDEAAEGGRCGVFVGHCG